MVLAAAHCGGIPELHNGTACARPRARGGVVDFGVRAVVVVSKDVGIHRQHLAVRKQGPSFFIINIELPCTRRCPCQGLKIQQSCLRRPPIGLHETSLEQNDAFTITNRRPPPSRLYPAPTPCSLPP